MYIRVQYMHVIVHTYKSPMSMFTYIYILLGDWRTEGACHQTQTRHVPPTRMRHYWRGTAAS